MDYDGSVKIETKLDTTGIDKGVKTIHKNLDKVKQAADKTTTHIGNLNTILGQAHGAASSFASKIGSIASSSGPYVAAAVAAIAVTKKLGETMRECTDAYKVQHDAENALKIAAQNNPYLDGQAVANLKQFASELQSVSEIGDEVSINLMAQLAATGRTEQQIKSIMKAAADYAAGTGTDIASAVQTLNATYSGMAGSLGKQIGAIKDLTEEQLKNGDAVKLVAARYNGLAENLAQVKQQAANSKGDFQEAIGSLVAPVVDLWDDFWKGFYEKGTMAIQWIKDKLELFNLDNKQFLTEMIELNSRWNKHSGEIALNTVDTETLEHIVDLLKKKNTLTAEEQQLQIDTLVILRKRAAAEKAAQKLEEEKETRKKAARQRFEELKKEHQEFDDYVNTSNKQLQEHLKALELDARIKGKAVNAQDLFNIYLNSYIDLLTKTNGKITEGYPIAQKRLKQLEEAKAALDAQTESEKKLQKAIKSTNAIIQSIKEIEGSTVAANPIQHSIEQYKKIKTEIEKMSDEEVKDAQKDNETVYSKQELLENLQKGELILEEQKLKELVDLNTRAFDTYKKQQEDLLALKKSIDESEVLSHEQKTQAQLAIDEEYAKNKAALAQQVLGQVKEYAQQAVQIAQDAGKLLIEYVNNEKEQELAALNEKYEKGEIAENEYTEKSLEIKRNAARKEYQVRMFQWTASMLAAVANIAEGVSKAIAQGGMMGILTGTLVAAAGGVQIASIVASKPTPPSFAHGGIVGGSSYYGDHINAHVNSGEMITNFPQQRRLWAMLNGQEHYKPSFPITVNNTQSNRVSTNVKEQNGELFIDILDKHINKGLQDGTFDSGFAAMHAKQAGVSIV